MPFTCLYQTILISEHVRFVFLEISLGCHEHFPIDPALGNIAQAWKHLSPKSLSPEVTSETLNRSSCSCNNSADYFVILDVGHENTLTI